MKSIRYRFEAGFTELQMQPAYIDEAPEFEARSNEASSPNPQYWAVLDEACGGTTLKPASLRLQMRPARRGPDISVLFEAFAP